MMIKLALSCIILLLLPFASGLFCVRLSGKRSLNPLTVAAIGYAVLFSAFQIIYMWYLEFDNHFNHMQKFSQIALGILCLLSFILSTKVFVWYKDAVKHQISDLKGKPFDWEIAVYAAVFIFLIVFQLYKAIFWGYADDDDAYYLADAVKLQNTGFGVMHLNDPYTGFTTDFNDRHFWASYTAFAAVLANTIGIHAAALAHFVFPPIVLLLVNGIYGSIFSTFFRHSENKMKAIFISLIFINLLTIFGNATIFTNTTFLLTRTWQGKSLLANLMIPLEFLILLLIGVYYMEENEKSNRLPGLFLSLSFICFGSLALSSMALMMLPLIACIGITFICATIKSVKPMIVFALSMLPSIAFGILYTLK